MSHRLDIQSPQAPGDIQPVPLAQRPLTDIGFGGAVASNLADMGLRCVGDLLAAHPSEDFTSLPGVGPGTQAKITRLLEAYRE